MDTQLDHDLVVQANHIKVYYDMPTMRRNTLKETIIAKLRGQNETVVTKALDDVSFYAKRGECVALIGHNGCGKSTFLKVMAGILDPVSGSILTHGRVAPLIELGAGFDPELSGRENVLLSCSLMGLTKKEIIQRMDLIKSFSELGDFFDAPVKTYSSGMYMRLGFACTTAIDADLLLIDEILAVGDENFQKKCIKRMEKIRVSGVTIVLVTHDLNVIRNMADRAYVLDHGKVVFEGKAGPAVDHYLALMEAERLASISREELEEESRRQSLVLNDQRHAEKVKHLAGFITVDILSDKGPTKSLVTGEPWTLEFNIRIHETLDKPLVAGFAVNTSQGLRLFGTNTKATLAGNKQNNLLKTPGSYTIRFNCNAIPLSTGEYSVIAALHNHNLDQTIQILGDVLRFKVEDPFDKNNFDKDLLGFDAYGAKVEILSIK
jgi:ABC-type polysaccharide/polyol phosphate transport system ATPase subunit